MSLLLDITATVVLLFGWVAGSKPASLSAAALGVLFYGTIIAAIWL